MNGPRLTSERYSPLSYYSLGRVAPRDRLREPFQQRRQRYATAFMRYVLGPYCVCAGEVFGGGEALIGEVFAVGQADQVEGLGAAVGEVYTPGAAEGQMGCDC